jgi:hypothetical protein
MESDFLGAISHFLFALNVFNPNLTKFLLNKKQLWNLIFFVEKSKSTLKDIV